LIARDLADLKWDYYGFIADSSVLDSIAIRIADKEYLLSQEPRVEREQDTTRERALDLVRLLVPEWRANPTQVLWTIRITIVLLILILVGYLYEITLWNWVKLLIVPGTLALITIVGGAWFTRERARDTALQAYLAEMSELLIDKRIHREYARYADARVTARARTLAVLNQLDGKRKRTVLLFLREARLINRQQHVREGRRIYASIIGLRNADLSNACLRGIQLISTDRMEAVSLEGAILRGADLRCADLERADLRGADLRNADLRDACLRGVDADGSGETKRPADLRGADLRDADLGVSEKTKKFSNLSGTKLSGANLQGANLTDAKVANEQLQVAKSLQGVTMPDGTVHD
jgi:uncharacterized protein YjbI with pentapeptide repeats